MIFWVSGYISSTEHLMIRSFPDMHNITFKHFVQAQSSIY